VRKKIFAILSVLLLVVLTTVTGFSSKASADNQIVLKFWKGGNDIVWHDYYLNLFKEYEAKHPNIKMNMKPNILTLRSSMPKLRSETVSIQS